MTTEETIWLAMFQINNMNIYISIRTRKVKMFNKFTFSAVITNLYL